MAIENDYFICKSCVNRLHTNDNRIKCIKNHDNTDIDFHCFDYISEERYLERELFVDKNESNYYKKKVLIFFLIFALYKILRLLYGIYELLEDKPSDFILVIYLLPFVFIDYAFYYYLYKAKPLARRLGIFFFTLSIILNLIFFIADLDFDNFSSIVYYSILLYYVKYNKNYMNYFNNKNSLFNE